MENNVILFIYYIYWQFSLWRAGKMSARIVGEIEKDTVR